MNSKNFVDCEYDGEVENNLARRMRSIFVEFEIYLDYKDLFRSTCHNNYIQSYKDKRIVNTISQHIVINYNGLDSLNNRYSGA
jgi:hypothetical protein